MIISLFMFIYVGLQISSPGLIFQEKKMPTKHNEMPYVRRTIALNGVYNASIVLFLSRTAYWLLYTGVGGWVVEAKKSHLSCARKMSPLRSQKVDQRNLFFLSSTRCLSHGSVVRRCFSGCRCLRCAYCVAYPGACPWQCQAGQFMCL